MTLKPLYNKVLLQLEKETTALVVEPDLQNAVKGKIISVDSNPNTNILSHGDIKENDIVYFFIRDAKHFKINNQEYYLINDDDLLVVER